MFYKTYTLDTSVNPLSQRFILISRYELSKARRIIQTGGKILESNRSVSVSHVLGTSRIKMQDEEDISIETSWCLNLRSRTNSGLEATAKELGLP